MKRTGIEWTDVTWNPVTGCDRVSPGCDHCYAMTTAARMKRMGVPAYQKDGPPETSGPGFGVTVHPDRLVQPLQWQKPRMVFVNSMSDVFHEEIPDDYIAQMFAVMVLSPKHTFQILTKRHGRMRALLNRSDFLGMIDGHRERLQPGCGDWEYPISNVWLGVTVEDQKWADIRIPALLQTPAAVRFLSCEPLLGLVSLDAWIESFEMQADDVAIAQHHRIPGLDWVIVGGESGRNARPMHPDWARVLRDQCAMTGTPMFFKQWGEWRPNDPGQFREPRKPFVDNVAVMHPAGMIAMTKSNPFDPFERGHPNWATRIERVGKKVAGRTLDGRTHSEWPEGHQRGEG